MRSFLAPLSLVAVLAYGCAKPTNTDTGTAGSSGSGNSTGSGSAGTSGTGNSSGSGNTTGSGSGNTTGSGVGGSTSGAAGSSATGTAGSTGAGGTGTACVGDPSQLVNAAGWNCDLTTPIMIQGSWYPYGDVAAAPNDSKCTPASGNPCTAAGCKMTGTTKVDTTFAAWGCGLGMELSSSGGTTPTKSVYAGPVTGFMVTLTGSSGGNVVRIGFTQSATPASGAVAPFTEIPPFTNGWSGMITFAGVSCPTWAIPPMANPAKCTKTGTSGTPVDMQIQVAAGSTATTVGAFDITVTSVVPITSGGTGTGGSGGGTSSCTQPGGQGTLTSQYAAMSVTCPKEYIVQNNAWGQNPFAGQTVTYGLGTKFKVTAQSGTGTTTPEGYPSIFTGANGNRTTANSGLPRAVSSITSTTGGIQTSWTWAANGASGSYNAAYDVWFSTGSGGDPTASAPSGGYLMVWFYKPNDNQPIGSLVNNGSVMIGGKQFNTWYGQNGGKPVVSYVATASFNSWTFSLGDFIKYATTQDCGGGTKCLNSSWYLTNVFAGFEIWKGGVGLETTDFGVTVP